MSNRFQKSILLIVQYKYLKSCSKDLYPKIWFSAQDHAVLLILLNLVGFFIFIRHKCVGPKLCVPVVVPFPRGISAGPALKYFHMIHRVGQCVSVHECCVRLCKMYCVDLQCHHCMRITKSRKLLRTCLSIV